MTDTDLRGDFAEAVPLPGIAPTRQATYLTLSRRTVETGRRGVAAARAALHGSDPVDDGGEGERHTSAA